MRRGSRFDNDQHCDPEIFYSFPFLLLRYCLCLNLKEDARHLVSRPLDDLCICIWISVLIICLSTQITETLGTVTYYKMSPNVRIGSVIQEERVGPTNVVIYLLMSQG